MRVKLKITDPDMAIPAIIIIINIYYYYYFFFTLGSKDP